MSLLTFIMGFMSLIGMSCFFIVIAIWLEITKIENEDQK